MCKFIMKKKIKFQKYKFDGLKRINNFDKVLYVIFKKQNIKKMDNYY